jgi:hypothetical protein
MRSAEPKPVRPRRDLPLRARVGLFSFQIDPIAGGRRNPLRVPVLLSEERVGVEPTLDLRPNLISNQALSATQPPLLNCLGYLRAIRPALLTIICPCRPPAFETSERRMYAAATGTRSRREAGRSPPAEWRDGALGCHGAKSRGWCWREPTSGRRRGAPGPASQRGQASEPLSLLGRQRPSARATGTLGDLAPAARAERLGAGGSTLFTPETPESDSVSVL